LLRWNWGKKRVAGAASSHRGKDREESLLWLNLALPFLCYSRHFNLRAFALAVPLSSFFSWFLPSPGYVLLSKPFLKCSSPYTLPLSFFGSIVL
jgi:hypothetical protein